MIIVKLSGGLGNQLFQYATARSIANKLNRKLLIDNSWFRKILEIEDFSHENATTKREYSLEHYNIKSKLISNSYSNWLLRIKIYSKRSKIFNSFNNIFLKNFNYQVFCSDDFSLEKIDAEKRVYLTGYWQNNAIIEDYREQLLEEFTLKNEINNKNRSFREQIRKTNSVVIHFRRGDYINKPNSQKLHVNLRVQYYDDAIKQMNDFVKNPTYYIFSDEIGWVKSNIDLPKNTVFIDSEKTPHEQLYLMSQCNHYIIANSTFSWWGAWLNSNPKKIIIAPKYWYNDKELNEKIIRIPKDWTIIKN